MLMSLTNYPIILLSVALSLVLTSLFIPWLITNFFGQQTYFPLEILKAITNYQKEDPVLSDLTSVYAISSFAFIFSMIIYPISIAVMIAAVVVVIKLNQQKRTTKTTIIRRLWQPKISIIAGILVIAASIGWIYSIQSFKTEFSRDADLSGGIIGEEWKGKADIIVNRLIIIGFGPYLAIVAGIIAIFSYFVERTYRSESQTSTRSSSYFSSSDADTFDNKVS